MEEDFFNSLSTEEFAEYLVDSNKQKCYEYVDDEDYYIYVTTDDIQFGNRKSAIRHQIDLLDEDLF